MQIYTDANGIQTVLTAGRLSIDSDTELPIFSILWDTEEDGSLPEGITIDQLGGLVRGEGPTLTFDQSVKDADTALKATVAANLVTADKTAKRTEAKKVVDDSRFDGVVLRAFAKVVLDEINALRAQHSLSARTMTQLKNAIKNEIDGGGAD